MTANEETRERILQRISLPNLDGCMEWTGAINTSGYGHYNRGLTYYLGHRASYEMFVGPIPEGLVIDHLCRNRACCRPDHLEPVTIGENIRRGEQATKTHCVHGHEFTPSNTYLRLTGGRECRACRKRRMAEHKERRAAA